MVRGGVVILLITASRSIAPSAVQEWMVIQMANRFNAICGQEESDHKFLVEIIAQICDYAVDNDMKPNDTIMIIANNMLLLTEISNYDNWERTKKDGDTNG